MPRSIEHIPDLLAFARRLKQRREELGLSQRQLAFDGCTAAYISRLEAAARCPSRQMIDELAFRLETSRQWLETGMGGHGEQEGVSLTFTAAEIGAEMAIWFGPHDEEAVTWENLEPDELAALADGMRNAALQHVGGTACGIGVVRKIRRERLAELDEELAGRLKATATAEAGVPSR